MGKQALSIAVESIYPRYPVCWGYNELFARFIWWSGQNNGSFYIYLRSVEIWWLYM